MKEEFKVVLSKVGEDKDDYEFKITFQSKEIEKGNFEWKALNGLNIESLNCPEYFNKTGILFLQGANKKRDNNSFFIPKSDINFVKEGLEEFGGKIEGLTIFENINLSLENFNQKQEEIKLQVKNFKQVLLKQLGVEKEIDFEHIYLYQDFWLKEDKNMISLFKELPEDMKYFEENLEEFPSQSLFVDEIVLENNDYIIYFEFDYDIGGCLQILLKSKEIIF